MHTRLDYLNRRVTHFDYFSQFVTPAIIEAVKEGIGEQRIRASTNEHFNDIPLATWDAFINYGLWEKSTCKCCGQRVPDKPSKLKTFDIDRALLRKTGEGISCSTMICTVKAAATKIRGW